jgi:hypothetical protein
MFVVGLEDEATHPHDLDPPAFETHGLDPC